MMTAEKADPVARSNSSKDMDFDPGDRQSVGDHVAREFRNHSIRPLTDGKTRRRRTSSFQKFRERTTAPAQSISTRVHRRVSSRPSP
jgi:uncharacterized protein (UPF0218 family)